MNISMSFRNFEASDHLKRYAEGRFAKIFRYLPGNGGLDLAAGFEVEKFRHKADVVLSGDGLHLSAREESEDMYSTVDLVQEKLLAQVRRLRERELDRRRSGKGEVIAAEVVVEKDDSAQEYTIVESDRFESKPMMVEEAAMQLQNLGEEFLVFLNAETERVNVIYRRKGGVLGLVDPGM